jgi:hypothetical protein
MSPFSTTELVIPAFALAAAAIAGFFFGGYDMAAVAAICCLGFAKWPARVARSAPRRHA